MRFLVIFFAATTSLFADYWVDSGRTSNGDGSQANPWKILSDVNWTTVQTALNSGNVNIYYSSRASWISAANLNTGAKHTSNTLKLIGDQQYNLTASGTASWSAETTGSRAIVGGTGSSGGNIYVDSNYQNVWVQGFELNKPTFGGIVIGQQNPSTNVWNIVVTNCFVHDVVNSTGISFLFAETNCHDVTVTHCVVSNTPAESIYMGHFSFLPATITNIVVEYCTCVDTGQAGQGEIDIKPGCFGAIVRYNEVYRSSIAIPGSSSGTVIGAPNCQVYGNKFHGLHDAGTSHWAMGIYMEGDGDALGNGIDSTNHLIYNNLIYNNAEPGILMLATVSGQGSCSAKIFNNTIVSNGTYGVQIRSSNSRAVTILAMSNNIIVSNLTAEVSTENANSTITEADNNLYNRTSGNSWIVSGVSKTWAQWQALGYDAHGLNADPLLNEDYTLSASSPARASGANLSTYFTTDLLGLTRSVWDMGAYKFLSAAPQHISITRANIGRITAAP